MKTILQSCLKCLDRHNDKIINISSEMLEIRTRFMELLDNVQAEATVIDSATGDYSAYLQETFSDEPQNIATVAPDEPNAMSPPLTTLDVFDLPQPPLANGYGPLGSVGVMGSLPEDTDPMIFQRSPGKFAAFSARKTFDRVQQTYCPAASRIVSTTSSVNKRSYLSMAHALRERPCRVLHPDLTHNPLSPLYRAIKTK
jgi:hypothetical protein